MPASYLDDWRPERGWGAWERGCVAAQGRHQRRRQRCGSPAPRAVEAPRAQIHELLQRAGAAAPESEAAARSGNQVRAA